MKFRYLLFTGFASVALIPIAALTVVQLNELRREARDQDIAQVTLTHATAERLRSRLSMAMKLVEVSALTAAVPMQMPQSEGVALTMNEHLRHLSESIRFIRNAHIDNIELRTVYAYPSIEALDKELSVQARPSFVSGVSDLRSAAGDHRHLWHADALAAPRGKVLVSPPMENGPERRPTIAISTPIDGEKARYGILTAYLDLRRIGEYLDVTLPPGTEIEVLDNMGVPIVPLSNRQSLVGSAASERDVEHLRRLIENASALQPIGNEWIAGETSLMHDPFAYAATDRLDLKDGPTMVVSAVKLPDEVGGWTVVLLRDVRSRLTSQTRVWERAVFLLFGVLALSFAVAGGCTNRFGLSVEQLKRYVSKLGQGNPHPEPEDRVSFPAELRLVQEALERTSVNLDARTQTLKALNRDLEHKVKERTADLDGRNRFLRALLEGMAEGVLVTDSKARIVHQNSVARELLHGGPADDLMQAVRAVMGKDAQRFESDSRSGLADAADSTSDAPSSDAWPGDAGERVSVQAHHLLTYEGRSLEFECFHVDETLDKTMRAVQFTPPFTGLLVRDVTDREATAALKESLLSIAAHEFRTPVQAMRIQVESLLAEYEGRVGLDGKRRDVRWDPEYRREILKNLDASSKHLEGLIRDWLDVARIDGGCFTIEPEPVSLTELWHRAETLVLSAYPDQTLTIDFEPDAEGVYADAGRLTQLFTNLLLNAGRYAKPGVPSVVTVTGRLVGDVTDDGTTGVDEEPYVEMRVRDNGIGIDSANAERIFDRFFQVEKGDSRSKGGTGLGLVICRAICNAHGGSIVLATPPAGSGESQQRASRGGGRTGAEFVIILPVIPK